MIPGKQHDPRANNMITAKQHGDGANTDRDGDDDCFYIALFSALEQTHCACM